MTSLTELEKLVADDASGSFVLLRPVYVEALLKIASAAKAAEQFCTWLCEDSKKYPGTDAGNAAKRLRVDLRAALVAFKPEPPARGGD